MRRLCCTLALLLVVTVLTGGCAGVQRRPAPTPAPQVERSSTPNAGIDLQGSAVQNQGAMRYPSPRAGSAYDDPSIGVSTIASAIPGAGPVHALVLGNVAVVGLRSGDAALHQRMSQQIQASFPHVVEVRFTHDAAQVNRVAELGQFIRTGRSIAPFLPELGALTAGLPVVP